MPINLRTKISASVLILCLVCIHHSLNAQTFPLKLGQKYKGKIDSVRQGLLMTSGGSFDTCFCTTINKIKFSFCRYSNGTVKFICCKDKNFVTDHVRVGDKYGYVKKQLKDTTVRDEWGFSRFVTLPSGWLAFFEVPMSHPLVPKIKDHQQLGFFYQKL